MKNKFTLTVLIAVALALATASRAASLTETIERTIDFPSGDKLRVVNVNGPVKINSWDGDKCRVVALKTLDRDDPAAKKMFADVKVEISPQDGLLEIITRYPEQNVNIEKDQDFDWDWPAENEGLIAFTARKASELLSGLAETLTEALESHFEVSVAFEVTVPRNCDVEVKNVAGSVEMTGLLGSAEISCVSGGIHVEGHEGSLKASTVNGAITVSGAAGSLEANSVNGTVDLRLDRGREVRELESKVVNGSIRIALPADLGAEVQLYCISGGITWDPSFNLEGKSGGKRAEGRIGDGGTKISATVVSGNLALEKM